MLYPQPDRELLHKHMMLCEDFVSGNVIDVGGGNDRYKDIYNFNTWVNANIYNDEKVDILIDLNINNSTSIDPKGKYDTVICNQVLGDTLNPQFSINELNNLLKIGGYLIITESLLNEEHDMPFDFFRFTEYGIKHLLNASNSKYDIQLFKKRGKFFTVMFQLLNRVLINRLEVNDESNKILRKIFYLFLKINTKFSILLDRLVKHDAYNSFYLGWIIVARKVS